MAAAATARAAAILARSDELFNGQAQNADGKRAPLAGFPVPAADLSVDAHNARVREHCSALANTEAQERSEAASAAELADVRKASAEAVAAADARANLAKHPGLAIPSLLYNQPGNSELIFQFESYRAALVLTLELHQHFMTLKDTSATEVSAQAASAAAEQSVQRLLQMLWPRVIGIHMACLKQHEHVERKGKFLSQYALTVDSHAEEKSGKWASGELKPDQFHHKIAKDIAAQLGAGQAAAGSPDASGSTSAGSKRHLQQAFPQPAYQQVYQPAMAPMAVPMAPQLPYGPMAGAGPTPYGPMQALPGPAPLPRGPPFGAGRGRGPR